MDPVGHRPLTPSQVNAKRADPAQFERLVETAKAWGRSVALLPKARAERANIIQNLRSVTSLAATIRGAGLAANSDVQERFKALTQRSVLAKDPREFAAHHRFAAQGVDNQQSAVSWWAGANAELGAKSKGG